MAIVASVKQVRTLLAHGGRLCLLIGLVVAVCWARPAEAAGVVGDGTAASCTGQALADAIAGGGAVTFNCGPAPQTIQVATLVIASGQHVSLDGGGVITLSGGNSARLFVVESGGELTLSQITLADGYAAGSGGALWNQGTVLLTDTTVRGNRADGAYAMGGAVFNEQGLLTMHGGAILQSQATTGGGLANAAGTVVLAGVTVEDNQAQSFSGIANNGTLTLRNVVVRNNIAAAVSGYGGGVGQLGGALALLDSTVISNSAPAYFGGGVAIMAGSATIEQSQFFSNTAGLGGGGLYIHPNADAHVVVRDSRIEYNTTLSSNTNAAGGGIYNGQALTLERVAVSHSQSANGAGLMNTVNASELSLYAVTFSDNTATGFGGGLWLSGATAPHLINVTISANDAGLGGGGLFNSDTGADLHNVTLYNNRAPAGANLYSQNTSTALHSTLMGRPVDSANCGFGAGASPLSSGGFNLTSDGSCSLSAGGDQQNLDPQVGALVDNGAAPGELALLTHLPQPGSPAIDAGDAADCPAADERSYTRPAGYGCDIGAVEADAAPPQVVVPTPIVMPTPQPTPFLPAPVAELPPPVFAPAVIANGVQATIVLNPDHGYPGQQIVISGQAPAGFDQVRIAEVRNGQTSGLSMAQVVNGDYQLDFVIPPDATTGAMELCAAVAGAANAQFSCAALQIDAPPLVTVTGELPDGIATVGPASIRLQSLFGASEYVATIGAGGAFAMTQVPAGAYSYSLDGQLSKPVAGGNLVVPSKDQIVDVGLKPALEDCTIAFATNTVGVIKAFPSRSRTDGPFGIYMQGVSAIVTFEAYPQANGPIQGVRFEIRGPHRELIVPPVDVPSKPGLQSSWKWQFDVGSLPASIGGLHSTVYATPIVAGKPGCPIWHDIEVSENPFLAKSFQANPVHWDGLRTYRIHATLPYIDNVLPAEFRLPPPPLPPLPYFGRYDNRLNTGIRINGSVDLDDNVTLDNFALIVDAKVMNLDLNPNNYAFTLRTLGTTLPHLDLEKLQFPIARFSLFPIKAETPVLNVPVISVGVADVSVGGKFGLYGDLTFAADIAPLSPGLYATLTPAGTISSELTGSVNLLTGVASAGATISGEGGLTAPLNIAVYGDGVDAALDACLSLKLSVSVFVSALWGREKVGPTVDMVKYPADGNNNCVTVLPAAKDTTYAAAPAPSLFAAPAIVIAADGTQLSAFVEDAAAASETPYIQVFARFKTPGALTWSDPAPLTDLAHTAHTPVVAFAGPNHTPLVAWAENTLTAAEAALLGDDLNAHLRHQEIAYSTWNGATWSAPIYLTDDHLADGLPALAGSDSGAVLAWTRDLDGDASTRDDQRIAVTSFDPTAGRFGPIDLLSAPGGGLNGDVRVTYDTAVAPAAPYLAWIHDADSSLVSADDRTVAVATHTDGGWVLIDTSALPPRVDSPAISAGADGLHLAYLVREAAADGNVGFIGTNGQLWTSLLTGGEWHTGAVLGEYNAPVYAEQPVLATHAAETLLLFRRFGTENENTRLGQIALSQLTAQGSFGVPLYLTDEPRQNWQPALAINPLTGTAAILKVARGTATAERSAIATPASAAAVDEVALSTSGDPVDALSITTVADPAIDPLSVSTASPAPGQIVTATVTVRNVGRGLAGAIGIGLYAGAPGSGVLLASANVPGGLGFNSTYTAKLAFPGTGGQQPIYAELTTNGQNGSTANDRSFAILGQLTAPQVGALAAGSAAPNTLIVGWASPPTLYVSGFRILRGVSPDGPFELVGESNAGVFSDALVERGRSYCYVVQAFNNNSFSPLSPAACGTLPLYQLFLPVVRR